MKDSLFKSVALATLTMAMSLSGSVANAKTTKPNFLIIWVDDIGGFNISAYNKV